MALALLLTLVVFMVFGCAAVPVVENQAATPRVQSGLDQPSDDRLFPPMPSAQVPAARTMLELIQSLPPRFQRPVTNSVTLAWRPSASPAIAGYHFWVGTVSLEYTNRLDVGNVTNFTYAIVRARTNYPTYFFALTAVDADGIESVFSNEASYQIPRPPPPLVLVSFTLSGHGELRQTSDLAAGWSMPITLDGTLTVSNEGTMFYRCTDPNFTLTPNYQ